MEGKLIKKEDDFYSLRVDGLVMATSNGMLVDHKLSLKNCQSIEDGYDLDELASSLVDRETNASVDSSYRKTLEKYVKNGFKKALELLGDKKFTEDDIRKTIFIVSSPLDTRYSSSEIISSLQQTEWDVEVMMEEKRIGGGKGYGEYEIVPELDEDGCLCLIPTKKK